MTRERLPLGVYALTLTIFCLGTSEFMIAGLLPQMAADLHTSIPAVGNLITAFAIGMLVGAPVMTLLTLRLPRRVTLLAASTVFGLAHLIPVFSHSYPVILGSRVLAAVAAATFWAVSAVTVVTLVRSDQIARGMAALLGGMTLANIAGVPLGTFLGNQFGWRATFLCLGVAALLATVVTRVAVPETGERTTDPLATVARRELRVIRKPRLLLALATIAAFQAAVFCTFSYLAPLLTDVSGLPESVVPAVLLGFGVGSFIGLNLGGRYADRNLLANVLISLVALAIALLVLRASASHSTLVIAAVVLFGITGLLDRLRDQRARLRARGRSTDHGLGVQRHRLQRRQRRRPVARRAGDHRGAGPDRTHLRVGGTVRAGLRAGLVLVAAGARTHPCDRVCAGDLRPGLSRSIFGTDHLAAVWRKAATAVSRSS